MYLSKSSILLKVDARDTIGFHPSTFAEPADRAASVGRHSTKTKRPTFWRWRREKCWVFWPSKTWIKSWPAISGFKLMRVSNQFLWHMIWFVTFLGWSGAPKLSKTLAKIHFWNPHVLLLKFFPGAVPPNCLEQRCFGFQACLAPGFFLVVFLFGETKLSVLGCDMCFSDCVRIKNAWYISHQDPTSRLVSCGWKPSRIVLHGNGHTGRWFMCNLWREMDFLKRVRESQFHQLGTFGTFNVAA